MSIFPRTGVDAANTSNAVDVTAFENNLENCASPLFYSTGRCTPRFDPEAANAMLSELLNTMEKSGLGYDCSRLDNLADAVTASQHIGDRGTIHCHPEDIFRVNNPQITVDTEIPAGLNAMASGPLTVPTGVILTVNGSMAVV